MDKLYEGVPVQIIVMLPKLRRVLDRSREVGLKSNKKKVQLRVPEVSYVGHVFSADGLKPESGTELDQSVRSLLLTKKEWFEIGTVN